MWVAAYRAVGIDFARRIRWVAVPFDGLLGFGACEVEERRLGGAALRFLRLFKTLRVVRGRVTALETVGAAIVVILKPSDAVGVYSTALPVRRVRADGNGRATRVPDGVHCVLCALVAGGAASRTSVATASTLLVGARAVRVVRSFFDTLRVVWVGVRALEAVRAALLILWPRLAILIDATALAELDDKA